MSDNPGSDEAVKRGCKCARMDNAHGRGYMGQPGVFVISEECPLHGHDLRMERLAEASRAALSKEPAQ